MLRSDDVIMTASLSGSGGTKADLADTVGDTVVRWQPTWVLTWAMTSAVGSEGGLWYYRTAYWAMAILDEVDAIKRGGDAWIMYGSKTAIFSEPIVRSSGGFRYRRGSSDLRVMIRRMAYYKIGGGLVNGTRATYLRFCNVRGVLQ